METHPTNPEEETVTSELEAATLLRSMSGDPRTQEDVDNGLSREQKEELIRKERQKEEETRIKNKYISPLRHAEPEKIGEGNRILYQCATGCGNLPTMGDKDNFGGLCEHCGDTAEYFEKVMDKGENLTGVILKNLDTRLDWENRDYQNVLSALGMTEEIKTISNVYARIGDIIAEFRNRQRTL